MSITTMNPTEKAVVETTILLSGDVHDELRRQFEKWGPQDHAAGDWWLIVTEEFGELAKATLEGDTAAIFEEATHVIACLARFVEKATRANQGRLTSDGWAARQARAQASEGDAE